jgi:hypothetical protein
VLAVVVVHGHGPDLLPVKDRSLSSLLAAGPPVSAACCVLIAAATNVLRAVNTIAADLGLDDADRAADVASVA